MQPITQTQLQAEAEAHFEMVLKEVIDTALAAIMHHIDELQNDEIDISRKLKIEVCYPTKLAVDLSWDDLVGVFKPFYFSRNQQVERSTMIEKYNWLIFAYFGLLLFHHSKKSTSAPQATPPHQPVRHCGPLS